MAGLLAIAVLLGLGAAGLSGHLVGEDHCMLTVEGSSGAIETHWTPPGVECVIEEPSGVDARGHFTYDGRERRSDRTGSWPLFFGALLGGLGVVGLALRRRPDVPAWLRLAAVTTLTFAVAGTGTLVGGWLFSVVTVVWIGVPVAFLADRLLRPGRWNALPWTAGPVGAAVAVSATVIASFGYLAGFGAAAYGLTILLVAAVAALPWRRLSPRRFATR
jgi:hypothetical protein